MRGHQIGNYVIDRQLGAGGMGSVYLALHRVLGGRVAIKILQPHLARVPQFAERFLREARAATRAAHPGIVKILDYGFTPDGLPYLAMEFLDGKPLSKCIAERGRLELREALSIGRKLAVALAAAHAKRVIHRDLKPDNIMRLALADGEQEHVVKIVDFGIARMEDPADLRKLTRTGSFLGTPSYMAPEVILDPRQASDRSDVYALGVILYQMLVGETPFGGQSIAEIVLKHLNEKPPSLRVHHPGAPAELCVLVRTMLDKKASQRPTMKVVAQVLTQVAQHYAASRTKRRSLRDAVAVSRGPSLRRIVAWTAPSLLIGAMALGLTREPSSVRPPKPIEHKLVDPVSKPAPSKIKPPVFSPPIPEPPPRGTKSSARASEPRPRSARNTPPPASEKPDAAKLSPPHADTEMAVPAGLRDPFGDAPAEAPSQSASELLRRVAEQALLDAAHARSRHQLKDSITQARRATQVLPDSAWSFIGALSCEARQLDSAKEAYQHLGAAGRQCMEDTCRYFGVTRRGSEWHAELSLRRGLNEGAAQLALQDAEQAYLSHLYERSIDHAQLALRERYYDAWQAIGRAACMKADRQLARDAVCRLEPLRQQSVRYVCRRNRIELPKT